MRVRQVLHDSYGGGPGGMRGPHLEKKFKTCPGWSSLLASGHLKSLTEALDDPGGKQSAQLVTLSYGEEGDIICLGGIQHFWICIKHFCSQNAKYSLQKLGLEL